MSESEKLENALGNLAKDPTAKSKIGRLRELWPHINQLNRSGVPHERIWQTLRENGFSMSFASYRQMLWRIRHDPLESPPPINPTPKKEPESTEVHTAPVVTQDAKDAQKEPQEQRPGELPKFDYAKHRDTGIDW